MSTFFQPITICYKFNLLNSGIGRVTAITFAKAGWAVVLFARRADRLQETVAGCPDSENTLIVQGDVTDEAAVSRLFASAVERFGMSCLAWTVQFTSGTDLLAVYFQGVSTYCSTYVQLFCASDIPHLIQER